MHILAHVCRPLENSMPDEKNLTVPATLTRVLTPEAQRALAEAAARRAEAARTLANKALEPQEVGGRDGPDPIRFGDWEKGGIVSDF